MPGFWTIPGGRVDAADADHLVAGAQDGEVAFIAAAARELGEETGYAPPLEREGFVDAGRWITPSFAPKRFDTRFYLVEIPEHVVLSTDGSAGELESGAWVTAADGLARWASGEWLMAYPTRCVLRALIDGMRGAAARCVAESDADVHAPRVWDYVPGVAMSPLRTPTLPPATHTNCYLIGCEEIVVIDPASPYDDERAALDEAIDHLVATGRRVVEIWLTHHHGDHVSGAAHLAARLGVPVAAHAETAARLPAGIHIDRYLVDGEVRVLAGEPQRRLRAVATPGHAPGHLCFYEETSGYLVAGDMVAGVGTILIDPSEGDMAAYLASLARMKALTPRVLLPAHGPAIIDPAAKIDEYVAHRLWREARVLESLIASGPATPGELVGRAYDDVPSFIHPLAQRSLVSHLCKLVDEGRVVRDGERWTARVTE